MCCHEAAHAVAVYRLEFPYHYVRFTIPTGLDIKDTDLGIDVRAMDVARRYLEGTGQDAIRYWAGYLSVLAIAKHANIHLNHVPEDVAARFARSDYDVFNAWLATFSLAAQQQLMVQVNQLVNDIWSNSSFCPALDAVANALLTRFHLTPEEVIAVIEGRAGTGFRPASVTLDTEHVRGSAFYYYTRRIDNHESGTAIDDWHMAERAVKYAVRSIEP